MSKKLNVVIWNEYRHEKLDKNCAAIYPEGIHGCIKNFLKDDATIEAMSEQGSEVSINSFLASEIRISIR